MKKQYKILICVISAIIVLALAITGIIIHSKNKKIQEQTFTIAFYDVDPEIQNALTEITSEFLENKDLIINYYNITRETELSEQIKKQRIDLIYAPAGYAVNKAVSFADEKCNIQTENLGGLFSSMRNSVITKNGNLKAVPLVFDNLEIDIEYSEFSISGLQSIATWEDIEKFGSIQKNKIEYPFSFAGTDSVFLLDLLGALAEAFDGVDAYNSAAEILKQSVTVGFDAKEVANKLFINPDAPIPLSLYNLKQLVKNGYVTPAAKFLTNDDINSYLQQRVTNLIFTTLSKHRSYDVKAIDRFSTIYVPSKNRPEQRHFTATITYAVPVAPSKNKQTDALIDYLLSTDAQKLLCNKTGLAPVLANCSTPDHQSDDARFWIAATSTPLAGLGHEADLSDTQKEQLRDAILGLIF